MALLRAALLPFNEWHDRQMGATVQLSHVMLSTEGLHGCDRSAVA